MQIVSINPNLPEESNKVIESTEQKIKSREIVPFTGPIKDKQGKEVIAAGHWLTDQELAAVNWYVEGIDAKIPN